MSLELRITELREKALQDIDACIKREELDSIRSLYLGKKGELTSILRGLKDLSPDEKRVVGQSANQLREGLEKRLLERKDELEELEILARLKSEHYDALQPVEYSTGHMHPISQMFYQIEDIFYSMGFSVMDGPETETDDNNFTRLNFSEDHPARDDQDTFWTEDGNLLRTQTSPVQIRSMQQLEPPFRIIAPGRVFRYEELDASHENTFHQVEGMMVDRNVSVAHLIHVLKSFLSAIFEKDIKIRLRPGYFPFVEPGFELDINCILCDGNGCQACKRTGWMEFLGCGLVHPNVLRAGNINPREWNGFAFGMGVDRLVMLKHGIEDIRYFMSGNLRFLNQF